MDEGAESWVWSECQACPQCYVLSHRADGCAHLACRCGCHYCFICGGPYSMTGQPEMYQCCCEEFQLNSGEAYLVTWMCFKNDAHPALGDCRNELLKMLS